MEVDSNVEAERGGEEVTKVDKEGGRWRGKRKLENDKERR